VIKSIRDRLPVKDLSPDSRNRD